MKTNKNHYDYSEWKISEHTFDIQYMNKSESLFTQGNGYMGIRGAYEEAYYGQQRNAFVAGTFNTIEGENEVPELPNFADLTNTEIYIDGERFSMTTGKLLGYERTLHLFNGELTRTIHWESAHGKRISLSLKRFISLSHRHVFVSTLHIQAEDNVELKIKHLIDGKVTNHGAQHFKAGDMKFIEKKIAHFNQKTIQSNLNFNIHMTSNVYLNGIKKESFPLQAIGRRDLKQDYHIKLDKNTNLVIDKIANVHTSRDNKGCLDRDVEALYEIKEMSEKRYDELLALSTKAWKNYWDKADIIVKSQNPFYQTSVRLALYHLRIMTPVHDSRMGIGAKGLTGEDYKGHSFWDTEIYILPFWIATDPKAAKQLLKYRGRLLKKAKEKAIDNGYRGAMYPWETAWVKDGECTPEWGNMDILTGEREPIWTGKKQIHITSDIIYTLWKYYQITGDEELMQDIGYEMILETAMFWESRLEYDSEQDYYELTDVIGPDEYKEHIDNNAFTNYMCYWNLTLALYILKNKELSCSINKEAVMDRIKRLESIIDKIYLPSEDSEGIIPQDDTYLSLQELPDLSHFKNSDKVLSIFKSYSMTQLHHYQVSKQADIVLLFLLLKSYFKDETIVRNFNYYESKTLHDSSLSYAMHALLAIRMGNKEKARVFLDEACRIDLNHNEESAKTGIHAAAMGGIWQVIVLGFGGISYYDGECNITTSRFSIFDELSFTMVYRGVPLKIRMDNNYLKIINLKKIPIDIKVDGVLITVIDKIKIEMESNHES